jgi:hypothetical protein
VVLPTNTVELSFPVLLSFQAPLFSALLYSIIILPKSFFAVDTLDRRHEEWHLVPMKSAFCCRLVLINHPRLEVHNKHVVLRTAVVHDEYLDSPTPSVLRTAVVHAEYSNSQHLRCFCIVTPV